jgi:hypothetical protein
MSRLCVHGTHRILHIWNHRLSDNRYAKPYRSMCTLYTQTSKIGIVWSQLRGVSILPELSRTLEFRNSILKLPEIPHELYRSHCLHSWNEISSHTTAMRNNNQSNEEKSSRRWQARPRNFTPSHMTALRSTDSKKTCRNLRNYVKKPKMTVFRHQKMHVRIDRETWNFVEQLVNVQINSL